MLKFTHNAKIIRPVAKKKTGLASHMTISLSNVLAPLHFAYESDSSTVDVVLTLLTVTQSQSILCVLRDMLVHLWIFAQLLTQWKLIFLMLSSLILMLTMV